MDKMTFLEKHNLSETALKEADISWEELALIEEDYMTTERTLREIVKSFIDEYLYDIDTAGIHSYRYRTKNVSHLLEKVVRKRKENPEKFCQSLAGEVQHLTWDLRRFVHPRPFIFKGAAHPVL